MNEGHKVKLTFDDGAVGMTLMHPEGGCSAGMCEACGRQQDQQPDDAVQCGECNNVVSDECWLQGWADNMMASELLHGHVTIPISARYDGDHATFHIVEREEEA